MNKVGRPVKYLDENIRYETRRTQNRENQRNCRKRKKVYEEIESFCTLPINKDEQYRTNLVNFFKQFDYDYFMTGTVNPNFIEKDKLKKINEEIRYLNQTLESDLSYQVERKISIKSLRKYTEKYIQHLSDLKLIKRCFIVFEVGKNRKFHVHILFKTNLNVIDFNITSENRWLVGTSITEPILTEQDKVNLFDYCMKELNPSSNKIQDVHKIDNWFFFGDYEKQNELTRLTNEPRSPKTTDRPLKSIIYKSQQTI